MSDKTSGERYSQQDPYDPALQYSNDEEKNYPLSGTYQPALVSDGLATGTDIREEEVKQQNPLFRWLNKAFDNGVEARGIERVPDEERSEKHFWGLLLFWWSVNIVLSTFPIGLLAQAYYTLDFRTAVAAIVTFSSIGSAACAFVATLGPKTGLRTMVISRYSVGYVGGMCFSFLNILTQLGFSVTAVIIGGQTLTNVSNGKLPLEASIVIVGFITVILCFIGYDALHQVGRYAWVLVFIWYCCMIGLGHKAGYDLGAQVPLQATGKELAGNFLSFGGIVFSSAAGWAPVCADFNCRLPSTIPAWKVFVLTWFGLMVPLVFIETASAALMTVPAYSTAFGDGDAGAVLSAIFEPWGGGGKFILVLLSFSIISNCTPNTYSTALSIQALHPVFQKVPRALWTILAFMIYTVAAIAGREHFSAVLSNFLSILGYWIAFFIVVLLEENLIFRKHVIPGGYDLSAYNEPRRLPVGAAGIFACLCGVGAAVVSMAQVWYVGPLAKTFGPYGGDLGFEMSFIVTGLVFPPLRYLEYRYFKR